MSTFIKAIVISILFTFVNIAIADVEFCMVNYELRAAPTSGSARYNPLHKRNINFAGTKMCREGVVYVAHYMLPSNLSAGFESVMWNRETNTPKYCHCTDEGKLVYDN